MSLSVTPIVTLGSGGSQGSDLVTDGVDEGSFYSMQTSNYIDEQPGKSVALYSSAGVQPISNVISDTNVIVYTPVDGTVFATIRQQAGHAVSSTLQFGVIYQDNADDANSLASFIFNNPNATTVNGVDVSMLEGGITKNRISSLLLNGGLYTDSGPNISKLFYDSNGITSGSYPAYTIKFSSGGSKWAAKTGLLSFPSVTIDFRNQIVDDDVANLIQMLDINDPANSAFGLNIGDYATFSSYYTNFLDSVGKLLLQSVQGCINNSIVSTTSPDITNNTPYATLWPSTGFPKLDINNKNIADDINHIRGLIAAGTLSADTGNTYIANLNQEQKMLASMANAIQSDINQVVMGDGSAAANISTNSQFGKFCALYKEIMDRLWAGLNHATPRAKNAAGSSNKNPAIAKKWQVEPTPSVILGNGIDSNMAAAEASNQIVGVPRNNSNNLGTYTDFIVPLSVLDIIRDEAVAPKKDNVVNTKTITQPANADNCAAFWANQDPQAILDTMMTLKIQLCTEIDNMSNQMSQLKRLQFSNDFKLASLLSGFKGISFSNFGIPAIGSLVPTFSMPNFGIPDYSLSDFGIPNIGLDLNTNFQIPNITLPKLNIPSVGGISLPSIQSFNFNWESLDVTLPKVSIQNMTWSEIAAKLQVPNINWTPDFNFSILNSFTNPLSCGGLPTTAPGVKLKFDKGQSCSAASSIQAVGSNPATTVAKTQQAQKTATATLTKYGDLVDGLQKSMTKCSDLESALVTCQQQFVVRVQTLQQQATTQISTDTNTTLTQLNNAVPSADPAKTKTALTSIPTTQTTASTPAVQVS